MKKNSPPQRKNPSYRPPNKTAAPAPKPPEAVVWCNNSGIITKVGLGFTALFGYSRKECLGHSLDELIVPREIRKKSVGWTRQVMHGKTLLLEGSRQKKDGSIIETTIEAYPVVVNHKHVGFKAVYRDVTDQKRAAEAFRLEKAYLEELIETAPEGILALDENSMVSRVNGEFLRMFGYKDYEVIGKPVDDLIVPDHLKHEGKKLHGIASGGRRFVKESVRRRKDGSLIEVSIIGSPIVVEGRTIGSYAIYRDVTERKNAERAIRESEQRYRAFFDNVPVGIFQTTQDGRYLEANAAHLQIFGFPDIETLRKMTAADLYADPSAREKWVEMMDRENVVKAQVYHYTGKDGRTIWTRESARTVRDENGRLLYYEGTVEDITALKEAEAREAERMVEIARVNGELRAANEEAERARAVAEAASQAKGMFLARMSHEIRTPMNSVIGFSDMLLDTALTEEQAEFVRNITKSGEALLALINEILDFSKIEAGQLAFQNIDFDPEVTAFDVCALTQPRLGNRPVEVLCRVSDNLPGFIKSDPTRIRQVLLNLMSNAVKFTHKGEIELAIDVEEETDTRIKLHTKVRDTGIGIPKDKLDTVFELFQQGDGSITRKYGGTGLGLAICRQIARHMEGQVWVESELEKGSTFHFTAWVDKSDKTVAKQPPVRTLEGKRALLIDDNENNLNILEHTLGLWGMRTEKARTGLEVIPALRTAVEQSDPFDLCVLDIQMPDLSGYEVSKLIREDADPKLASVKVLAFSSSVSRRLKAFKESGFDGFLPKPIQRHKLMMMLKRLLGEAVEASESEEEKEQEAMLTQHTLAEEAKHSVRILLAEDNPMNQKLAQFMLTKAGYHLMIAGNGREAVEKYVAEPERYDLIFMDVHMPEVDGLEATRILRNRGFKDTPIIAMTADAMKEDRDKCLESGMNDYLSKPIKRDEVFAMVRKWVFREAS
ncbi:MAG: PAS domain S-box protein [Candidatus Aminicenantes bacterium]|nr:PAS domain S-box protein [Candidatus Aminicenantes bacterium]